MNAETFDNTIRRFLLRRPFVPFAVELNSGRHIEILRPNELQLRDSIAFYTPPDEKERAYIFDHDCVCLIHDVWEDTSLDLDIQSYGGDQ